MGGDYARKHGISVSPPRWGHSRADYMFDNENGVIYKVFKNTLIKRAVAGTEFEGLIPDLEGPTALAVSKTDATAPGRIIAKYAKEIKPLELKGGVVEGDFYDQDGISQIALIPGREELIAKVMGSIQSPVSKAVRTFAAIAEAKRLADISEGTDIEIAFINTEKWEFFNKMSTYALTYGCSSLQLLHIQRTLKVYGKRVDHRSHDNFRMPRRQ